MVSSALAVGTACVFHAAFAPQLDYTFVPAPQGRPPIYVHEVEVRLASGRTQKLYTTSVRDKGLKLCALDARHCEDDGWSVELDGIRLTLLAFEGDPVVGARVRATGIDQQGNRVPLPGAGVRWVKRPPPRPFVTKVLFPGPSGSGALGRATAMAFSSAVTTCLGPELDFSALPDGRSRPQMYSVILYPLLASNDYEDKYRCPFRVWAHNGERRAIVAHTVDQLNGVYALRYEADTLRLALYAHAHPSGPYDRITGLVIESNGPLPAVRWTMRPEVRELLQKK